MSDTLVHHFYFSLKKVVLDYAARGEESEDESSDDEESEADGIPSDGTTTDTDGEDAIEQIDQVEDIEDIEVEEIEHIEQDTGFNGVSNEPNEGMQPTQMGVVQWQLQVREWFEMSYTGSMRRMDILESKMNSIERKLDDMIKRKKYGAAVPCEKVDTMEKMQAMEANLQQNPEKFDEMVSLCCFLVARYDHML